MCSLRSIYRRGVVALRCMAHTNEICVGYSSFGFIRAKLIAIRTNICSVCGLCMLSVTHDNTAYSAIPIKLIHTRAIANSPHAFYMSIQAQYPSFYDPNNISILRTENLLSSPTCNFLPSSSYCHSVPNFVLSALFYSQIPSVSVLS